jgi:DNA-binding SARP family transcriptional activator
VLTDDPGLADQLGFALLGPVEARWSGELLKIGGNRRALLTMLLLNPDRVVSISALTEGLWGPAPPPSAKAQIQTLVHGLRRTIRDATGITDLIETRSPGYLLRSDRGRIDLAQFDRHCEQARSLAAEDRAEAASAEFGRAIQLRRGTALSGVEAPFVALAAERLEERYGGAAEEWIELELALGRHHAIVADLRTLVGERPLRERLRGQFMLALYRCGRTAEALEVYQQGRRQLAEEVGLDPGQQLQRLQLRILDADPELELRAPDRIEIEDAEEPSTLTPPPPIPLRPAGFRPGRRLTAGVIALTAVIAVAAGLRFAGFHGPDAAAAGLAPAQWIPGPAWSRSPAQRVSPRFFGVTTASTSGTMPSFQVGTVRLWDSGTRWQNVEPQRGRFAWNTLDRLVGGARQAGLPVLFVFGGTPDWASPNGTSTPYGDDSRASPPDDLADWDAYVTAVVHRYHGRIQAYELWNLANNPLYYSGDLDTLVEMTRRASAIIRKADPGAELACPSMGDLWKPAALDYLYRFAASGVYRYCTVAPVKLYQKNAQDPPETMIPLAATINATLHRAGVEKPIWDTGTTYQIALEKPLGARDANDFAVRFYLVGLYIRFTRMYFYSWGSRKIPLVLQAEGGAPTQAALGIEQLQNWLAGARISSCGHGLEDSLPNNTWQCRFVVPSPLAGGRAEGATVIWTDRGTATVPSEPGAYRVDRLDGSSVPTRPGQEQPVGEEPVLIRSKVLPQ